MRREPCTVEIVGAGWERTAEVDSFVYEHLYRAFGVEQGGDWRESAHDQAQAIAFCDGSLVGVARLLGGTGESRRQLRQVAVDERLRGRGVGRALVEALEARARLQGGIEVWLNAREDAFAFYESLGYRYTGGLFVSELTRIPHRPMVKRL